MAKILLVEDDNNLREIYEARLQAEGYDIVAAKDGEEALAVAIKERPDLIISDVMMPKISGFDMLDILRSTTETKHAKVIMMTALSQAEDQARAQQLGADRYLVKSQVTLEDVARVAKEVLESDDSKPPVLQTNPVVETAPTPPVTPTVPEAAPAPVPEPIAPVAPEPVTATEPVNPEPVAPAEPASSIPPVVPQPDPAAAVPATDDTTTTSTQTDQPSSEVEKKNSELAPEESPEGAITIPGLPPLYDNAPEGQAPTPQPQPLRLEPQQQLPTQAAHDSSSPSGQAGAPFLVSEPAVETAPSSATPPVEVDESAQIAANIESFLSTKENAAVTPAPQPEVAATPAPVAAAPAPQEQPPVAAEASEQTEEPRTKSGYKVIQPLSDMTKPPVDLEALAQKEEALGAAKEIINTNVTNPGDEETEKPTPPPPAGQAIDPTSLAL